MNNNSNNELLRKIASLETKIDMLESELSYMNEILSRCGFPEGIKTLKETVEELLAEEAEASKSQEYNI
ncbi:MAG: hypothetical protein V4494_03545 [Chlamydiota bacterium]